MRLTEEEFQKAVGYIVALGQKTTDSHNEAVLISGSLGFSALICLLNNGNHGATETTANLLGPFLAARGAARLPNGATLIRSPIARRAPTFVKAWVKDTKGNPVEGADVDVDIWHSSTEGAYENQDPAQADMNLRGIFTTDADGHIRHFPQHQARPAIRFPVDGPTGDLLRAQGPRQHAAGASAFPRSTSPASRRTSARCTRTTIDGTSRRIRSSKRHPPADRPLPAATRTSRRRRPDVKGPWYSQLEYTFEIEPGIARMPRPPITAKARGERPQIERLKRA